MSERTLVPSQSRSFQVPAIIAEVGPEATKRFFEFFTVPIRNKNTRIAYYQAIGQFLQEKGNSSAGNNFGNLPTRNIVYPARFKRWWRLVG